MFGWGHVKLLKECRPSIVAIVKRCINQSYYDILKVPQTCSSKDVRDAFITLSKQNHPDKHGNDPSMHERFVEINEAYSVLINPTSRRQYDMTLGSKRKLNAPHDVYTTRSTYTHRPTTKSKKQTGSSSYSSSSGSTSEDYFYTSWEKRTASEEHRNSYYGIKGIKKVSNLKILLIIIGFACVGGTLQWLAIRAYSKSAREKMLENSRKLGLIHAMAREKARLYGNEYQINILKNTLKTTYDVEPETDVADVPVAPEPIISDPSDEACGKCIKCKKL